MSSRRDTGRHMLGAAIALCFALSLAPARLTSWIGWLAQPVGFVIQPIAHPTARLTRTLLPTGSTIAHDDPVLRELETERDHALLALRQAELRIEQLERQVRDLQAGVPVAPRGQVRQLWAAVASRSSNLGDGTIRIAAGRAQGVEPETTIATARGVHLVGRVIDATARSAWVLPFNHPRTGHIEARVIVGDSLEQSHACQLLARTDGMLEGDMVADAAGVERGQLVRLDDPSWPHAAQMLVLGRVIETRRKENQRLVVVVRPEILPDRVSEVVLWAPDHPGEGGP